MSLNLKVISYKHPDLDKVVKENNLSGKDECVSSGMYFHGRLEEETGFDMFMILNLSELPLCVNEYEQDFRYLDYEGEVDVEVYGNSKKCIGYIWKPVQRSNIRKGLICYPDDKSAKDHVMKCYQEKRFII